MNDMDNRYELPRRDNEAGAGRELSLDDTQEIDMTTVFQNDPAYNGEDAVFAPDDAATEFAAPRGHKRRNALMTGGVMLAATGVVGGAFWVGRAVGGDNEGAPLAHKTTLTQETPQPTSPMPSTETPTPSNTSPTDLPSLATSESAPIAAPNTPAETQPSDTPSTSETVEHRDTLQPAVPVTYFQSLIDKTVKEKLLDEYSDTPSGKSLSYLLSDNVVLQKGIQDAVNAKGIHQYQKRLLKAYSQPEVARVLGTPLGIYDQDIVNYLSSLDTAVKGIVATQDALLNNIAGAVHNPTYNTIPGVDSSLTATAFLSEELAAKNEAQIDNGANRFYRVGHSDIVAARTVSTLDGHQVDVAAVVSDYENGEIKLNWFAHVPLGEQLAAQIGQPADSSIFVPFASYVLGESNQ